PAWRSPPKMTDIWQTLCRRHQSGSRRYDRHLEAALRGGQPLSGPNFPCYSLFFAVQVPKTELNHFSPDRYGSRHLFPVNSLFLYIEIARSPYSCGFLRFSKKIPC